MEFLGSLDRKVSMENPAYLEFQDQKDTEEMEASEVDLVTQVPKVP